MLFFSSCPSIQAYLTEIRKEESSGKQALGTGTREEAGRCSSQGCWTSAYTLHRPHNRCSQGAPIHLLVKSWTAELLWAPTEQQKKQQHSTQIPAVWENSTAASRGIHHASLFPENRGSCPRDHILSLQWAVSTGANSHIKWGYRSISVPI